MTTDDRFHIRREDGRSNQQVIIDFVKDCEPGRIFTFQQLLDVLNDGSPSTHDRRSLYSVVTACSHRLLEMEQRTLKNLRGVGYQLAYASEHSTLALARKHRADVQVRHGLDILRHVRWNELDANQRALHESQLLIIGGLYQQQQAFDRRLRKVELAIRKAKE